MILFHWLTTQQTNKPTNLSHLHFLHFIVLYYMFVCLCFCRSTVSHIASFSTTSIKQLDDRLWWSAQVECCNCHNRLTSATTKTQAATYYCCAYVERMRSGTATVATSGVHFGANALEKYNYGALEVILQPNARVLHVNAGVCRVLLSAMMTIMIIMVVLMIKIMIVITMISIIMIVMIMMIVNL